MSPRLPLTEAAAVMSARKDAMETSGKNSLNQKGICEPRRLVDMLWTGDIGTAKQCLHHDLMNIVLPASCRPGLTLVVSRPDRPDVCGHEDMLRPALLRQLDAGNVDAMISNLAAMEPSAASSLSVVTRPIAPSEAAAMSGRNVLALKPAPLSPTRARKQRQLAQMIWPEDIGTTLSAYTVVG